MQQVMRVTPPEVLRMKRRGGAEEPGLWPGAGALSRPQQLPERSPSARLLGQLLAAAAVIPQQLLPQLHAVLTCVSPLGQH